MNVGVKRAIFGIFMPGLFRIAERGISRVIFGSGADSESSLAEQNLGLILEQFSLLKIFNVEAWFLNNFGGTSDYFLLSIWNDNKKISVTILKRFILLLCSKKELK